MQNKVFKVKLETEIILYRLKKKCIQRQKAYAKTEHLI